MTGILPYELLNHHSSCAFPYAHRPSTTPEKSYHKFYQLKLRQFFTKNRSQGEHEEKSTRPKESMNHLREKTQYDNHRKRASSVLSTNHRRTKESAITKIESRPKTILKNKQSSVSTKRHQRVASAPANRQRNLRKKIPTIEIEYTDEQLAKSNAYSYTRASSSSESQLLEAQHDTRQSVLNSIMLHLYSNAPADLSKWNLYRDFDEKFSASLSPRVYRNFERIIL